MRRLSILPILILLAACDDNTGATEFRQGEPEVLSQYEVQFNVFDFAELAMACPSKDHLAITYTRYPKHATGSPLQVIGLGFSVSAGAAARGPPMKLRRLIGFILLAALALAVLLLVREGGCDRDPPPDDDDMEPACKPGDSKCYGAEPSQDLPPG